LDVERAFKAAKKYGRKANSLFGAISVHVGCRHPPGLTVFENSVKELANFGHRLEKELGIELSMVDVGGGFPPRYKLEQTGHNIEAFANIANEHLAILQSSPILVVEPGRYLVGDAIVGLGSVVRKKKSSGQSWALLDIGVNVLIPLGFANYDIVPCQLRTPEKERVSIGGPLCQPNDEFIRDASLDLLQGDIVAIFNAGAYTLSMAGQFGYPRPGIVRIDQGEPKLIRRSESFKAVWESLEQI
ncbi:MAG: diaminopimelate decarboxylase family protein, partial [Candidatus Hodarchaeota archaeon]